MVVKVHFDRAPTSIHDKICEGSMDGTARNEIGLRFSGGWIGIRTFAKHGLAGKQASRLTAVFCWFNGVGTRTFPNFARGRPLRDGPIAPPAGSRGTRVVAQRQGQTAAQYSRRREKNRSRSHHYLEQSFRSAHSLRRSGQRGEFLSELCKVI